MAAVAEGLHRQCLLLSLSTEGSQESRRFPRWKRSIKGNSTVREVGHSQEKCLEASISPFLFTVCLSLMATEMTACLLITGTGKEILEPLRIIDLLSRFLQTPNKYVYP